MGELWPQYQQENVIRGRSFIYLNTFFKCNILCIGWKHGARVLEISQNEFGARTWLRLEDGSVEIQKQNSRTSIFTYECSLFFYLSLFPPHFSFLLASPSFFPLVYTKAFPYFLILLNGHESIFSSSHILRSFISQVRWLLPHGRAQTIFDDVARSSDIFPLRNRSNRNHRARRARGDARLPKAARQVAAEFLIGRWSRER